MPVINGWNCDPLRIKSGIKVPDDFVYSSETNPEWMTREELIVWLEDNQQKIGQI